MSIRGIIFDIDGTLIDSNSTHVEAWRRAFERVGYRVGCDRIVAQIGKGGDQLVPSILGKEGDKRDGGRLRRIQKDEFLEIAGREQFPVFPKAQEIFAELRERRIRTALATSSDERHFEATLVSAGVDFRQLADVVVTRSEADSSKPAPDIVVAAVEELKIPPEQCAMFGDTIYDGQACQKAGEIFLGVLSGGSTKAALLDSGAQAVWHDIAHLLSDLDRALKTAFTAVARP
jgi:HAD superfamily hydrolase (TIGR01509 family)